MRVAVLVKQVPDVGELRLDPVTGLLIRAGVPAVMNPYDRTALSLALRWRDELAAEVVAVSMGPPAAASVLRECLAGGVDRAVLISDPLLAGSDTWVTARVLAAALDRLGPVDLVVCGQHSTDAETGQVPVELATVLGRPHVTAAAAVGLRGGGVVADRELDAGFEAVAFPLPAVVSVVERLMKPRRIPPAALRAVPVDAVEVWDAGALGLRVADVGTTGSPTRVRELRSEESRRRREILTGAGAASGLVERLLGAGALGGGVTDPRPAPGPVRPCRGPAVLVVAEPDGDALHPSVDEILGEAWRISTAMGGHVAALDLSGGAHARSLAAAGADAVLAWPAARDYSAESWAWALLAAVEEISAQVVVAPAGARGRDYMPVAAARLRAGLVGDSLGAEVNGGELTFLKPALGGAVVAPIACSTVPAMATIRPGTCAPLCRDESRIAPVRRLTVASPSPRVAVLERRAEAESPLLPGVRGTVLCVGHGVGGPDGVEAAAAIAERIGAVLAGTRRVVDSGWLPRSRQVGITGHALTCRLYIGAGVRGAANHVAGLRRVGTVVAVNQDDAAPVFAAADYGLVCDWREGLEALAHALEHIRAAAP